MPSASPALARTGEPAKSVNQALDPADTVIGVVPVHLQHLHNLVDELTNDLIAAEQRFLEARKRRELVRALFFDALETHVPSNNYVGVSLCTDWQVVGLKRESEEQCGGPNIRDLLQAVLGGKAAVN